MLDANEEALTALDELVECGSADPERQVQDRDSLAHNLSVLRTALGYVDA